MATSKQNLSQTCSSITDLKLASLIFAARKNQPAMQANLKPVGHVRIIFQNKYKFSLKI
jgi:hypothetical protein